MSRPRVESKYPVLLSIVLDRPVQAAGPEGVLSLDRGSEGAWDGRFKLG